MFEDLLSHGAMLADRKRLEAYHRAIRSMVRPGDVVLDIGSGSGILALWAAQSGARRVYAVEQDPIIEDAMALAKANGLDDKVVFIRGRSDRIELPEKADLLISEILGHFALDEDLLQFLDDARKRLLRPGARMIPEWIELLAEPVEVAEIWERHIGIWDGDFHGLDYSSACEKASSRRIVADCSSRTPNLARPISLARLDLRADDLPPADFTGASEIRSRGLMHGWAGYFRAGLSPEVTISTAPDEPSTHWQQTFFPWPRPVPLVPGDKLRGGFKLISLDDGAFWEWTTEIDRPGQPPIRFQQSDLVLSGQDLEMDRDDFTPVLTPVGAMRRQVLDLCDGRTTIAEISERLLATYPGRFKTAREAARNALHIFREASRP